MGRMGELASENTEAKVNLKFEDFWKAYPKRKGSNPKSLARTKWDRALKNGATAEQIISAAKSYRDELSETGKIGTEFVCMAATWINQKRYEDYEPTPESNAREQALDAKMKALGWEWNGERWVKMI